MLSCLEVINETIRALVDYYEVMNRQNALVFTMRTRLNFFFLSGGALEPE